MKKSYILIILISFLLISPKLYAQVTCPCNFDTVPKTTECWVDPFSPDAPDDQPTYINEEDNARGLCGANNDVSSGGRRAISIETRQQTELEARSCGIVGIQVPPACGPQIFHTDLTPEELKACQCELLAYVTALNDVDGITVSGGPPYTCGDVDCRTATLSPIPTLSEWGLIAMAGVLGIVGYLVIRRRKVTA